MEDIEQEQKYETDKGEKGGKKLKRDKRERKHSECARVKRQPALAYMHPSVGIPLWFRTQQISDVDQSDKWILDADKIGAFLNPAYHLDFKTRRLFTWAALLQLSRSLKKNEHQFAGLLKLFLQGEMSVDDFEEAVFKTEYEPPAKKSNRKNQENFNGMDENSPLEKNSTQKKPGEKESS